MHDPTHYRDPGQQAQRRTIGDTVKNAYSAVTNFLRALQAAFAPPASQFAAAGIAPAIDRCERREPDSNAVTTPKNLFAPNALGTQPAHDTAMNTRARHDKTASTTQRHGTEQMTTAIGQTTVRQT